MFEGSTGAETIPEFENEEAVSYQNESSLTW